jgi:hypothetical protein
MEGSFGGFFFSTSSTHDPLKLEITSPLGDDICTGVSVKISSDGEILNLAPTKLAIPSFLLSWGVEKFNGGVLSVDAYWLAVRAAFATKFPDAMVFNALKIMLISKGDKHVLDSSAVALDSAIGKVFAASLSEEERKSLESGPKTISLRRMLGDNIVNDDKLKVK